MTQTELYSEPKRRAAAIARILDDKKISDIIVLGVGELCSFADFFVIATADNTTQLRAAEAAVYAEMRDLGVRGRRDQLQYDSTWAVIDYGDVIAHLFLPESRDFYRLENLWGDAPRLEDWASAEHAPPSPDPEGQGYDEEETPLREGLDDDLAGDAEEAGRPDGMNPDDGDEDEIRQEEA